MRTLDSKAGEMTQGTVFSCAASHSYDSPNVHGVVVNARCDLAHNKVASISYLPLVPLRNWLQYHYSAILIARLEKELRGRLAGTLKAANKSASVLRGSDPKRILDLLLRPDTSKAGRGHADRFEAALDALDQLQSVAPPLTTAQLVTVTDAHQRPAERLLGELTRHALAGFHYIESTHLAEVSEGWVVLLGEVQSLPGAIVQLLRNGLHGDSYVDLCEEHPSLNGTLRMTRHSFAQPVARIRSPDIEHLVQRFANQFVRVGVEDYPNLDLRATLAAKTGGLT